MTELIAPDDLEARIVGTTIDPVTLLSTDYFNHFNEIIMLLGMLPDMPDMMPEIDAWEFLTYEQHFAASGLGFAPLAIEAYAFAPSPFRRPFDALVEGMRDIVDLTRSRLRRLLERDDMDGFGTLAIKASSDLQSMVDTGSAIVHGGRSMDQSAVDDLF